MIIFKPEKIREDFPVTEKAIYLDNACMSLKPKQVVEKMNEYYTEYTACAGRSSHELAKKVETEVEQSRNTIRKFINAKHDDEIIFLRNTTEGINLVSKSLGLQKGDEVVISDKEHNSNLIPWLRLKAQGIKVNIVNSNEDNTFSLDNFEKCITEKTKIVAIGHRSNLDGVTVPAKDIIRIAHRHNALVMLDGAQSVPGTQVDVRSLDADFVAFSGHKMLGPTGTGVLYGKKGLLEKLHPYTLGGETVINSTYEDYTLAEIPHRFEAGLQDYAGIIGLAEAARYLSKIGMNKIEKHEIKLNKTVTEQLDVDIIGPDAEQRSGIFSFNIKGIDPHHVSKMLDVSKNIMTRSGQHCVHSWFNKHKIDGSVRASFYAYNTEEEANTFAEEVNKIKKLAP